MPINFKVLAIIPARGGSKGVPKKNIKILGNKPLIAYTIETAKKSKLIDDIAVSTDCDEIKNIVENYGQEVYFKRPKNLAGDKSLTSDVVEHAKIEMERITGKVYDALILLQPTCPFRKVGEIDQAIKMLMKDGCTSVVTVKEVDGNHPFRMKRINNGFLNNFIDQGFEDMRPRQDLPKVYIRDGSIYAVSALSFKKCKELVTSSCRPIINDCKNNINIDNMNDFKMAEILLDDE